ncbi:MAG: MFS transporter [Nocardiopsaceae bacterium]|nr:MFS transporter [Nocardiopsaceae bacterium]
MAGDQLARVALTVLVYARTASALLAAVTFVASVLPLFVGGLTLGGLADRFPRRAVMIACDLLRCALVLLMVVPGVPVAALVVLLCAVTLISAPFTAARSATLPDVLDGEKYVLGQTVTLTTAQFAQVIGFGVGGVVVGFLGTGTSLVIDAATYALSAFIVRIWVRHREPAHRRGGDRASEGAPGETVNVEAGAAPGDGGFRGAVRVVFGTRALLLPMLFGWLAAFYNAPEGVAAPLAAGMRGGAATVGLILAAQVLGETFGMLIFGRLVPPELRRRWMGPLAVAACAVLTAFAAGPGLGGVVVVLAASGAFGGYQPAANAAFVSAAPMRMRGAAFGIAQGGMSLGQGILMIAAGGAADGYAPSAVIAVTGAIGAVCAAGVAVSWTRPREGSRAG